MGSKEAVPFGEGWGTSVICGDLLRCQLMGTAGEPLQGESAGEGGHPNGQDLVFKKQTPPGTVTGSICMCLPCTCFISVP